MEILKGRGKYTGTLEQWEVANQKPFHGRGMDIPLSKYVSVNNYHMIIQTDCIHCTEI